MIIYLPTKRNNILYKLIKKIYKNSNNSLSFSR